MEEFIISKEDYKIIFNEKNIINKNKYLLYKKTKKVEKYYHYFITSVCHRLKSFENVFKQKC